MIVYIKNLIVFLAISGISFLTSRYPPKIAIILNIIINVIISIE